MSFPQQVYALVRQVPSGCVTTYGTIACLLGDPRKARQVGWAMAATPDGARVPAHRVVRANGALAGRHAFGGEAIQRALLEAEGVTFLDNGCVDLDSHLWLFES